MFETIEQIMGLVITALTLLTALGYFIGRTFKNERALKYARALEEAKMHVKEYMSVAENLSGMTSQEKRDWVCKRTQDYLKEKGVNLSDELVEAMIEEMIAFSKQINAK